MTNATTTLALDSAAAPARTVHPSLDLGKLFKTHARFLRAKLARPDKRGQGAIQAHELDDAMGDLMLNAHYHAHTYDPERALPLTWLVATIRTIKSQYTNPVSKAGWRRSADLECSMTATSDEGEDFDLEDVNDDFADDESCSPESAARMTQMSAALAKNATARERGYLQVLGIDGLSDECWQSAETCAAIALAAGEKRPLAPRIVQAVAAGLREKLRSIITEHGDIVVPAVAVAPVAAVAVVVVAPEPAPAPAPVSHPTQAASPGTSAPQPAAAYSDSHEREFLNACELQGLVSAEYLPTISVRKVRKVRKIGLGLHKLRASEPQAAYC